MSEVLDKVEKRGYEKGFQAGMEKAEKKFINILVLLISDGKLTVSEGAEIAKMSIEEFERKSGLKA